ncbi:MAG: AMP-binding protein, partial [Erythrobacter sp.]|nr:AMP-binding protein [Erythrobacter sp.]
MATTPTSDFTTFDEYLTYWGGERPEGLAFELGERQTTYGEADRLTRQIITFLGNQGIGKGDRIAFLGKNSDRYFLLLYACGRMGAVMAPIGWRLAPPEIGYILKDTGAKLLISEAEFLDTAQSVSAGMENGPQVFAEEESFSVIKTLDPAETSPLDPDAPILQLYTSGTTGNPKGAQLSNRNLFSLRKPSVEENLPWQNFEESDCILATMPIAHIGGTGVAAIAVANGVRVHILPEFTPQGALEGIEAGATLMFLVPAAIQIMIQHPKAAETDFSSLRYLMYGAAPMPLELLKEAVRTMPTTGFMQVYGMTETTGTISLLPPEDHDLEGNERMRSAGKAVPGVQIEVRGEDNVEVPRGTIGEICILSPSNTAGYWQLPEATAKTIDPDGWLHTGDAGIMDADGYVYIQDRIKDMIISGGENVYPAEVESAIYGHPAIAEVAVIGIPSEKWGEE